MLEEISQSEKTLNSYISKLNDYMMQKNESEQKIAALHMWFAEQGVTLILILRSSRRMEKLQRKTIRIMKNVRNVYRGRKV